MGHVYLPRKGGAAAERTAVPTINFVSKTAQTITVTFTNNDSGEVEIYYGLTAPLTDTVILATNTTSSNITFSGLADDTTFTIFTYAIVTNPISKKIKSEVVSTNITTNPLVFTAATGGTTLEYDSGGKRYRSHTFTSNGTFEITQVGDDEDDRNQVDYLIIAGGGGGAGGGSSGRGGAGGGGGGFISTLGSVPVNGSNEEKFTVTQTSFSVNVGGGGATSSVPGNGGNSSTGFPNRETATGGGKAGNTLGGGGGAGGSGGGGGINLGAGGIAVVGQGTDGLQGPFGSSNASGNRGGGAGGAGGLSNSLETGSNQTYSAPGIHGGGASGAPNTGKGGNGGSRVNSPVGFNPGGAGGSGIVVIRYEIAPTV
jgi:hypothetical protein